MLKMGLGNASDGMQPGPRKLLEENQEVQDRQEACLLCGYT